jgi:hypothetical protein
MLGALRNSQESALCCRAGPSASWEHSSAAGLNPSPADCSNSSPLMRRSRVPSKVKTWYPGLARLYPAAADCPPGSARASNRAAMFTPSPADRNLAGHQSQDRQNAGPDGAASAGGSANEVIECGRHFRLWHLETCRRSLKWSGYRGGSEVTARRSKRRF